VKGEKTVMLIIFVLGVLRFEGKTDPIVEWYALPFLSPSHFFNNPLLYILQSSSGCVGVNISLYPIRSRTPCFKHISSCIISRMVDLLKSIRRRSVEEVADVVKEEEEDETEKDKDVDTLLQQGFATIKRFFACVMLFFLHCVVSVCIFFAITFINIVIAIFVRIPETWKKSYWSKYEETNLGKFCDGWWYKMPDSIDRLDESVCFF
jgi:hypothetical protein